MSQFEAPMDEIAQPRKTSGVAIAALVSSLIFCCPITTILGPILGIIAMGTMGMRRKGRVLAIAAIVIGVGVTAGQWMVWTNVFRPMLEAMMNGPAPALTVGFGGDYAGFNGSLYGVTATDDDAKAFIDELRSRYGEFSSSEFAQTQQTQPKVGTSEVPFQYRLTFANATLDGEAVIVFADRATGDLVNKPRSITVFDPDKGDLVYPPKPSAP